jgi:hypothetical protein
LESNASEQALNFRKDVGISMSRFFYTNKNAKGTGGFTAYVFDHVVIKTSSKTSFAKIKPKVFAKDMADQVEAGLNKWKRTGERQWSSIEFVETDAAKEYMTMLHEVGHQVHYWAGAPKRPENLKWFTQYSMANDYEFHAEGFAMWMTNREAMRKVYPEVASYFDDLMEKALAGQERVR